MGAGAPAGNRHEQIKELVRAFAGVFGRWPDGHDEWGTWCAAFAPLIDLGVTPEQLALRAHRYREHFKPLWEGRPELELSAFGLTKHWQLISASLESSFFALYRWAGETAWRLDDIDSAMWVLAAAERITDEERVQLRTIVEDSYRAHTDPSSAVLQWVETKGWALDDAPYGSELADRLTHVKATSLPDVRRRANERRLELRTAIARLDDRRSA